MTRGWSRRGWRGTRAIAVGLSVFAIGACTDEPTAPVEPQPELHGAGPLGNLLTWDLPLRSSAQLALPRRARPCDRRLRHLRDDEPHRQFEFWVGDWNVTNVNDVHIGTNIVTSELDGCLIQEHWTASNGSRGLSLNAYDRETGMWHQTWASQVPQGVFGRLRPSGNLVDGKLVLTGTRDATGGFTFQDTWTWEENEQGQVIQTALAEVPALNFVSSFTGIYTRGAVTPAAPLSQGFCAEGQVGGETRQADFLVGSWKVVGEHGLRLGTSVIESDVDDCLVVEHFESRGGLKAISYTYIDLWVERWFRTYVDSEGERLELSGGFEDGALVLRGTEDTRHGPVEVTITWRPEGGKVKQVWEVSQDGGATWERTATLVYERQ